MASEDVLILLSVVFKKFGLVFNEFLPVVDCLFHIGIINLSFDSYVFFDKYPSVNIFMEEIACRIVMELAGIIDRRVLR